MFKTNIKHKKMSIFLLCKNIVEMRKCKYSIKRKDELMKMSMNYWKCINRKAELIKISKNEEMNLKMKRWINENV